MKIINKMLYFDEYNKFNDLIGFYLLVFSKENPRGGISHEKGAAIFQKTSNSVKKVFEKDRKSRIMTRK
jgi:hypothetical protein